MAHDTVPGRTNLWGEYMQLRGDRTEAVIAAIRARRRQAPASARRTTCARILPAFEESGVDQVIFLQQAGRNRHDHICESLELFAAEVMPAFKAEAAAREARKAEELAPYIAAALKRKPWMKPLADHEIPVVKASVDRAQFARGASLRHRSGRKPAAQTRVQAWKPVLRSDHVPPC